MEECIHALSIAKMLRTGERINAPDNSACSSEVYVIITYIQKHTKYLVCAPDNSACSLASYIATYSS